MSEIGRNIKIYREAKGLTQEELAEAIGKTKNVVSNWENGRNKPDADTIEKLLNILEVDANTLFGWDDPKQLKSDAADLADKLLTDPKIKNVLPMMRMLSVEDMELAKAFIQRLLRKDEH